MKCDVCFHHCDLKEGQKGFCRVRMMKDGKIVPENYGLLTSLALDPIEKKPLARFHPGSMILSCGSYGCPLRCPFCQNHSISQNDLHETSRPVSVDELVDEALRLVPYGNIGIAFTYNEPMAGFEFIRDAGKLAHKNGLKTVVVTSGAASLQALEEVLPYVDAFNIDLKGFSQKSYDYVGGSLEMTKDFILRAAQEAHVEITTLVVPGVNDSIEEMEREAQWIASIDPEIPLHITRYFPGWKERREPTDLMLMKELRRTAQKYLRHVYLGNV